ncbi:FeoA family protein [Schleiferia thermophila]|jgi:ferrous iron transport protein A|uniref:Ferrous iron transport protein A n=1 Tax=Schleiferia thermophila TaxID=884107 RepID=A0A369A805_9FLAO|nr:FeoA family protein [Schleiferia thermophila]KFD38469.1 iron transporter [Schleiferia thermophila str. Yellowstone]RCX03564.1 ferrous iron transport protein A [Schleiferia thermophila]GCD79800.1 iron transporter [Schleiferia thermophila]
MKTVAHMEAGQTAVICENGIESIPLKLLELGCLPGITIKLVRKAPLNDPLYIEINGNHLLIRTETARLIPVNCLVD